MILAKQMRGDDYGDHRLHVQRNALPHNDCEGFGLLVKNLASSVRVTITTTASATPFGGLLDPH
jgi:hypothetical protein